MLKKWKKTIKFLATTTIVLIYLTIGLFGNEALKGDEKKKKSLPLAPDAPLATDRYPGVAKTIIGYSREFRMRQELEERIECEAAGVPREEGEEEDDGRPRWTEDKRLGIQVFSAYYDRRQEPYHYVRIIGLLRRNSSFYCQVWYRDGGSTRHVTQKATVREVWSDGWGPKSKRCEGRRPAVVSCLAPLRNGTGAPSWVSFVDGSCSGGEAFVRIRTPPPPPAGKRKNFVICVKPLESAALDGESLREWVEINRRLGAEGIVFYARRSPGRDPPPGAGGLPERKEFESPPPGSCPPRNSEESIWHKRKMEIIAYNDCFYSNLRQTKFVIPLDVDEIIVPKTGNNWFEAFRSHFPNSESEKGRRDSWPEETDNYASFSVRNAYFFPLYPRDAVLRSSTLPKRHRNVPEKLVEALSRTRKGASPGENIFDRTLRSFRLSPGGDSVKSFVSVANTLSVFNHYAFHVLGDAPRQLIFPETVFQLNHYRNSCDSLLIDGCREFLDHVVYDDSLERFRKGPKPDTSKMDETS